MRSPPGAVHALVLRHAPTGWNDAQRRQGWADESLTDGARQAARAWARRAPACFSRVVSSDLKRARETAQIIAASLAVAEVEVMAGLREQHQGAWTGLTKGQIKQRWPERLRERPRRPVDGESPEALQGRVLVALAAIAAAHRGGCVLIVAHGGVVQALERAAGTDTPPVPYLEGRWFQVISLADVDGFPSVSSLLAGELTAGRRTLAARRSPSIRSSRTDEAL